jgi:hypothetical protein
MIVRRPTALGAVGSRYGALQIRPEYLEIDDGVQPLEIVALGRKGFVATIAVDDG